MPQTPSSSCCTPKLLRPTLPGIGWLPSRCLQAPPHPLACVRCIDTCPAEALAFQGGEGVALLASDACHGCAQCVAVCPTEALVNTEIETLLADQTKGEPLRLGCHRVGNEPGMARLHCLRSLGPDQLAWLSARAAPEAVALYLPDGCHDCPAAPQEARDAWHHDAKALAAVIDTPSRNDFHAARPAVSRRDLLRGRPAPRLPAIAPDDAAPKARRLQRKLIAAQALGDTQTALVLPGLSLDPDACRAHGVCARVCPTEALQETPSGELIFNALDCLDCGHCLTACPEGALQRAESHGTTSLTLRETRTLDCFECGRRFNSKDSGNAGEATPTCSACQRERTLLQESFHDLFG
jgi:Fe-S-cluster-containing hydrogenase component 2